MSCKLCKIYQEELNAANEKIGSMRAKLEQKSDSLKKADSLINRAHAEISMLEARIEKGHGANKRALMQLYVKVASADHAGIICVSHAQLKALGEVAL